MQLLSELAGVRGKRSSVPYVTHSVLFLLRAQTTPDDHASTQHQIEGCCNSCCLFPEMFALVLRLPVLWKRGVSHHQMYNKHYVA